MLLWGLHVHTRERAYIAGYHINKEKLQPPLSSWYPVRSLRLKCDSGVVRFRNHLEQRSSSKHRDYTEWQLQARPSPGGCRSRLGAGYEEGGKDNFLVISPGCGWKDAPVSPAEGKVSKTVFQAQGTACAKTRPHLLNSGHLV